MACSYIQFPWIHAILFPVARVWYKDILWDCSSFCSIMHHNSRILILLCRFSIIVLLFSQYWYLWSFLQYPIPMKKETQGRTDLYIGSWMKDKSRDKVDLLFFIFFYVQWHSMVFAHQVSTHCFWQLIVYLISRVGGSIKRKTEINMNGLWMMGPVC